MLVWLGRLFGGSMLATVAVAAVTAASSGITAIPVTLRRRCGEASISATIRTGGSFGIMIPPSLVVVIHASLAKQPVGLLPAALLLPRPFVVALFLASIPGL